MKKHLPVFFLCLLAAAPAAAEKTLQSEASKVVRRVTDDRFITFNYENDMIASGTDSDYTSGVRVTYFDIGAKTPGFIHALDRLVPTFSVNETTSVYYSLGQNLYTPSDIEQRVQDPNDRPWAAFLYGSAGITTITKNHVDEVEASLGVVGPAALGEQTQKFIHDVIDSPEPQGWDNQLENEPGVILSWQRRWPERYVFDISKMSIGAEPHFGVTLGNVYTYSNAGLSLRMSSNYARWQDDPVRVRPSMPGTGAFLLPENAFSWHLFGGLEGRAVARNIFLDGNTFRDSHDVDKKPFVADATAGVAFTWGKTRLSYAVVYRTKEFETQEDEAVFGTMSLGFRF